MPNYNKLLNPIENFFSALVSSPELYLQFVLALALLVLAVIISYYTKKHAAKFSLKNENLDNLLKGSLRFLTPVLAALFLAVATGISEEFFKDSRIMIAIARLSRAWLILQLIWMLSRNKSMARLITIMLVPVLVLHITGLFGPIASYLDAIDFSIGKLRLSLYLILKGLVALTIMLWLTEIISGTGERAIRKMKSIGSNTRELLIKFFNISLYAIVFLVTLNIVGVDLTALAVFGGALGVGIGFGLQKITSNFISGVILLAEKSIKDHDLIEIGGVTGFVKRLGARAIVVESTDGREVLIPNEDFMTSRVTNWTYTNTRGRAEIKIGVSYDSDIMKARELMLEAALENREILKDPAPDCVLHEFGDNAVGLMLYFWVADIGKGRSRPKSDIMAAIWGKFNRHNIKIPVASAAIGNVPSGGEKQ